MQPRLLPRLALREDRVPLIVGRPHGGEALLHRWIMDALAGAPGLRGALVGR